MAAIIVLVIVVAPYGEEPKRRLKLAQLCDTRCNVMVMPVHKIASQGDDIGAESVGHRHNVANIWQRYKRTMMYIS